jgi:hypothetical protein
MFCVLIVSEPFHKPLPITINYYFSVICWYVSGPVFKACIGREEGPRRDEALDLLGREV